VIRTELIRPVWRLLADRARERGGKLAFSDGRSSVGYEALFQRTGRVAGHLADLGLERGESVAMYMDNRVEVAECYLAAPRAGAVAVCINPGAPEAEAAYMLRDSGARIVVTDEAHLDSVLRMVSSEEQKVVVAGDEPKGVVPYDELASRDPSGEPRDDLDLDAPAWMLYTSGTTGRPKGVQLSQRSCLWVVAACWAPIVGLGPRDHVLAALPLFHSYALDLVVLGVAATGASEHLLPRFSVGGVRELLRTEPITFFPGVPTMFNYLLESAREEPLEASNLRLCVSAGAIMPATLNRAFEEEVGVPLLDGYGITETSTMVTMNWPGGTRRMGSCGLPIPGSAVRIVDPETGDDADPETDGEIWVRGPHVMLGYHDRPDATAEALGGGWYHTGDLARADRDGYITITGRVTELIIRGGENVYPAEVEEALADCEPVLDAAVVGRPHERLGEVPVAFVVPRERDRIDPDEVIAHCRERLSDYKVPEELRVVDEIPRTGSGKVMRHKLRELLEPASDRGG
jgi:long-chain acyl-CoA synthetase